MNPVEVVGGANDGINPETDQSQKNENPNLCILITISGRPMEVASATDTLPWNPIMIYVSYIKSLLRAFVLCMGCICTCLFALASPDVDSLHQALSSVHEDRTKASILMELCTAYRVSQPDSAIHYAKAVLDLTESSRQYELRSTAFRTLGILYKRQGSYAEALDAFQESLHINLDGNNTYSIVKDYDNIAIALRYLGEYEEALSYHQKAINLAEGLADVLPLSRVYANLANLYSDQTQYDLALEYYHKSLDLLTQLQDSLEMARLCNNIANTHFMTLDFESARTFYEMSLRLYQALGHEAEQSRLYSNLGSLSYEEGQLEAAAQSWRYALALADSLGDLYAKMNLHHQLGMISLEKKAYREAKQELLQAETLAQDLEQADALVDIYPYLAEAEQQLGNYKEAFSLLNSSLILKDSLQLIHSAERFSELSAMYETERTERQLAEANHQLSESRKTQILLGSGVLFLLLLLVIWAILSRNRRKIEQAEHSLMSQREELNRQIILDLLKAQEVESLNAMLEGQDQERQRIAADLHDSLGGTLAAVKVSLFTLQKKLSGQSDDASKAYSHTRDLLEEAYKEVRRISHDLAGSMIEHEGLLTALDKLCDTLREHSGLAINLESSGLEEMNLDGKTEVQLYRIVQEIFQNIIKHAQAKRVSVQLSKQRDRLNLLIEDDGVGFEYNPENSSTGIGLRNIAARVKQLKGTLEIDSAQDQGTTTIIDIPA